MGSYISSCKHAGKIMLPDGSIQEVDRAITVAELMLEHPRNFVVEFRPCSTDKLLPLPADHKLDPGKVYLMVPMAQGKANGIPYEKARRVVLGDRIRPMKIIPLVGMCMVGMSEKGKEVVVARDHNGNDQLETGEKMEMSMEVFEEEKAEFLCRQYSNKGWKPSLGTIQERSFDKKMPHWLF